MPARVPHWLSRKVRKNRFEAAGHPLTRIGYERNAWDERIEISGTNGRLEIRIPKWDASENTPAPLLHYDNTEETVTEHRFDAVSAFDLEMAYLHRCLSERTQGRPDVIDGFNVDSVLSACEESNSQKRSVEIDWKGL